MTNGFTWFLVGGLVGAAVALFYAPQTGAELRSTIGHKADDLIDQVKKKAGRIIRKEDVGPLTERTRTEKEQAARGKGHQAEIPAL